METLLEEGLNDEMATKKREPKRSRALQVSMPERSQYLCIILSSVTGSSVAGMINSIIEPYLQFTVEHILKKDGYMDEYGRFLIDPEKIKEIYEERSKGTVEYLKRISESKGELAFDFVSPSSLQ